VNMRPKVSVALTVIAALIVAAAAPDNAFDRVVAALHSGQTAETVGNRGGLRDAASMLAAAGAVPADGQEDLSRRWDAAAGQSAAVLPVYRDRVLGPAYRALNIPVGGAATFHQTFFAGQRARVAVVGLNHSDFMLSITDDGDAGVCERTSRAACNWIPLWTTRFKLRVINSGRVPGIYFMLVQ